MIRPPSHCTPTGLNVLGVKPKINILDILKTTEELESQPVQEQGECHFVRRGGGGGGGAEFCFSKMLYMF